MTLSRRVFTNISYLLAARLFFRIATAAALMYSARYLGAERYGMFETALAWANSFLAINDLGMSTLIVREAARDEHKTAVYFGNTLIVETILSAALFVLLLGIGRGLHYNATTITLIAILGAAGLIFEFRKVIRGIFRVLINLKVFALSEIINGAFYVTITLLIMASVADKNQGLMALAWTRLAIDAILVLLLFIYTLRFTRPAFDLRQIPHMIKQSYVFTLYNIFFMLYFQVDQIILSIMSSQRDVGIYSAPTKIATLFLFIPIMIFQVTMPVMYRYSRDDPAKYKRINNAIWRYLAALGVPIGVGLTLLAPEIVRLVFGPEYQESGAVLWWMGLFLSMRFLGIAQGNSLTTTDRQGLRAAIQIISVVVNIVLDILLIPKYGVVGPAIATLFTEMLIAGTYLVSSARYLQESLLTNLKGVLPVLASAGVMSIAVFLLKPYFSVIFLVFFGGAIYFTGLWLFRFWKKYDKNILKEILNKNPKSKIQISKLQ